MDVTLPTQVNNFLLPWQQLPGTRWSLGMTYRDQISGVDVLRCETNPANFFNMHGGLRFGSTPSGIGYLQWDGVNGSYLNASDSWWNDPLGLTTLVAALYLANTSAQQILAWKGAGSTDLSWRFHAAHSSTTVARAELYASDGATIAAPLTVSNSSGHWALYSFSYDPTSTPTLKVRVNSTVATLTAGVPTALRGSASDLIIGATATGALPLSAGSKIAAITQCDGLLDSAHLDDLYRHMVRSGLT